jgi:hypothetical protein
MKYEIQYENMKNTLKCSPERAELPNIVREGYDTPILNDHNKAEYPPMHKGESGVSSCLHKTTT